MGPVNTFNISTWDNKSYAVDLFGIIHMHTDQKTTSSRPDKDSFSFIEFYEIELVMIEYLLSASLSIILCLERF